MSDVIAILTEATEDKKERLTGKRLRVAKDAVRKIENPIGKLLASDIASFNHAFRRSFHITKLRSDVARIVLAVRLYLEAAGRLPTNLDDLVSAKLLKSVPVDPFSGQVIQYSRQRAIIWSNGVDEMDGGGKGDPDADLADDDDFVWRLPQPRRLKESRH